MKNSESPFAPPGKFWSQSGWPVLQLVFNGLVKSLLVIASYHMVKSISGQLRNGLNESAADIAVLFSIAIFFIALRVHERYTAEKMSQNYVNKIRSALLKRLMRASVRSVQSMTVGTLSSRLAGDLSALKRWLSLGISRLISHGILLLIISALIISINATLGVFMMMTLSVLIFISVLVGEKLKTSIKNVRKNRIRIHSMLVERLASLVTVKTMGQEPSEVRKVNKKARQLEAHVAENGFWLGVLRGIGEASSLLLISVLFAFYYLNPGSLSAEEMMALISTMLFINSPVRELARVHEYYQGAQLSLRKIMQLFRIPRIVRGKSKSDESTNKYGRVSIRNLRLKGVFDGVSLRASSGEHIAITGANGSGKSTLVQIITGLIKADKGIIRVNGQHPLRTSSESRSRHIGVCGADINLFKTSLYKNMTYRCSDYSSLEFNELLDFCQLKEIINKYSSGLATQVKEHGKNFSSGEKARIALFRALLGNPELLILDEPESFLDSSGFEIVKGILKAYQGTVLIATHNKELISLCSRKWDIDKKNLTSIRVIKRK